MSKQLDKIYENFLEGTCKKYSVPAEAENLLKEGFAKYTAMCEASTTAHASFASDFASRNCKFLIPHFQKIPDRGETLTAHFTIQDCPCDAKYTLDGFTIESGKYAPASMGLGKRNKYEFVIRGGYPGWLKSSQSRKLELAKASNELATEFLKEGFARYSAMCEAEEAKVEKFRKKPVSVDAIEWTGDNFDDIKDFAGDKVKIKDGELIVVTREDGKKTKAEHVATKGDYVIRGVKGEFYFCKPDIFKKTYSPA